MIAGDEQKEACPLCEKSGKRVLTFTVRSLLKSQLLPAVRGDRYSFCANSDCPVIYYERTPNSIFQKQDLKIRVGLKEKEEPKTLCYCFGHTLEGIRAEIWKKGKSNAFDEISERIGAGLCHCEDANPEGRCCLGRVADAVREELKLLDIKTDAADQMAQSKRGCCDS